MTTRRTRLRGTLLCFVVIAVGACSEGEPLEVTPVRVQRTAAERGAEAFVDTSTSKHPFNEYSCATCHTVTEPSDRVRPGAPLAGVVQRPSFWGGAEIDLLRAVNDCLVFFMLDDEPWRGDEPTAVALYAYLESLSAPGAAADPVPFTVVREIQDVAASDASGGESVYLRACAHCHGAAHTGEGKHVDFAPVLPEEALAAHPLGEYTELERRLIVIEKVRHGGFFGYGGQMPPLSREKLSDDEVGELLAFLGL